MDFRTYILKVVSVAIVCLSIAFSGNQVFAAERVDANLEVEDVLSLPSEPMQLKALLFIRDSTGRKIGLNGESIEFFIQKRSVGKAVTSKDGTATLDFVPRLRGNLTITARIRESPRVSDLDGTGLLAAWEKRRPILLIDLIALLPPNSLRGDLPSVSDAKLAGHTAIPDPHANAREELEKLGKFYYNLVYLSRVPGISVKAVRDWIRHHQFPTGVPMAISSGSTALIGCIEKLKKDGWENLESGIGRSTEFAEVLVERRIQTVIIQESENDEKFPRRAKIVKGWNKVRRHL